MSDSLNNALRRRAIAWAGQLTKLIKSENIPAHIKEAVSSHVEDGKDGNFIIRTTASRQIAPDARAWEYGSGIKARRGAKQKYIIAPKNADHLVFPWDVLENVENGTWFGGPKLVMKNDDGKAVFNYVEHPGIQAANDGKGYIAPAMIELRKRGKKELSEDVRMAIVGDLRVAFGRKK